MSSDFYDKYDDALGDVLQKMQDLIDIAEEGQVHAKKSCNPVSLAFSQGAEITGTACMGLLKEAMEGLFIAREERRKSALHASMKAKEARNHV